MSAAPSRPPVAIMDDPISSDGEKFCSLNHAERTFNKMQVYLQRKQLTDVVLKAGDVRIPAHRLVLCAVSDYFAAMFTNDVVEATAGEVELRDLDPQALKACIQYIYTGEILLKEDNVEHLLATGCILQLSEVTEACCGYLVKQLHPSNCLGIRSFADSQSCPDLHRVAHNYTMENFCEVTVNQEFLMMNANDVCELFASDDLNVPNEEIVYYALLSWANHNLSERKRYIANIMAHIRLPLLSPQFLSDIIDNPLFHGEEECQRLIFEAMKYHLLPERRPLMQSARTRPRKSTVGTLYAVGGMDSTKGATSIEKYDLRTNTWTHIGNMSGRRLQFGVAVCHDKLFVVGGRDGLKTLNTVECYNPAGKSWSMLTPMGTHRHGLGVGMLEGPMYAVGGHDGWSYLSSVERYDPQSKQWSYVASMSSPRSTVGVAVLDSKLYAIGGRDGSACLRTVEVYDPHINRWTMCSPMSKRRGGLGVAVSNGCLYAIGGHDTPSQQSSRQFDCVERYDPRSDLWCTLAPMSLCRDAVGVAVLGNRIFAVGGYDGQTYLNSVECYDPMSGEWSFVSPLNTGRAGACVVHVPIT
ncbi:kelch-like protein 5 [Acanthaster planci]|uniref:Kelch-like protein 5 n=1 Tax=Acanthaster planci TaxID=133434 RepID=A0A8B7XHN4_ACAPL|nr:kelch-like protein 5 [Acanthaster planci]